MATEEVDLEKLSLEELAALANQELQQPRDEQGRFVSSAIAEQTTDESTAIAEQDDVEEVVYRRVIDLGDGSGTQVFEAPSTEELIEKLATAQEHATRKIRELTQAQKPKPAAQEMSEDERFVLGQELLVKPDQVLEREINKRVKAILDAELAPVKAMTRAQEEFNAGQEFVAQQPDYFPTPKNGVKIEKWLKMNSLDGTVENIQKAFVDLSESGLLETAPQTNDARSNAGTQRIAEPVGSVRRAASGVSSRRSAAVVVTTPTEDDLYNMPLEKLAELASRSKI